jgi:putative SOS response-associated peptidase YedK
MCGRFTLTTTDELLAEVFDLLDPPTLRPRYNIAPSQLIAVVGLKPDGETRGLALLRWGLVPHWAHDPNTGPKPFNARAETVGNKFAECFRQKRCLIPADGFYEWLTAGKKKRPHRFTLKSGALFGFAGLWDVWTGENQKLVTCCMITTTANELVKPLHDRMPVILPPEYYAEWLDPDTPQKRLTALLQPYAADAMQATEVGGAVNSPKNDGPECLEAA